MKFDEVKRLEAQHSVAKSDLDLFKSCIEQAKEENQRTIRTQQVEAKELGRKIIELEKLIEQRRQKSNQA